MFIHMFEFARIKTIMPRNPVETSKRLRKLHVLKIGVRAEELYMYYVSRDLSPTCETRFDALRVSCWFLVGSRKL